MKTTLVIKRLRLINLIYLRKVAVGFSLLFLTNGCGRKSAPDEQLEARLKALEASAPGVGTIMSGVQLYFAKLYFADKGQNWELAQFELHEVEENMDRAVKLRPEEHGTNLADLNDGFKQTQLAALKSAAERRDWNAFQTAYSEAMGVCNGCHEETTRPFIVVTIPTAPPVPNQQWEAPASVSEK
jgi:hypothetical protein